MWTLSGPMERETFAYPNHPGAPQAVTLTAFPEISLDLR